MKVLLIGDEISPALYNINVKKIKRLKNIELIISTGDLPFYYYDFLVSNFNVPLMFVFGNHVRPQDEFIIKTKKFKKIGGLINLDEKVVNFNGVLIGGLEGSMKYNNGPHQYTESEMELKILKMTPYLLWNKIKYGRYIDILVTHAPPAGFGISTSYCHRGFNAFIKFINKYHPKYLIHGHVHIYDRNKNKIKEYKGTKIINAYGYKIIEL